jgi:hypothetical protein
VPGCPDDPCALGFPPNDIRSVANTGFIDRHPDVEQLLESVEIPLADITRQNARMISGENTYDDIRRHAREWIAAHRQTVTRWLHEARALRSAAQSKALAGSGRPESAPASVLKVVTLRSEPFVVYRNGRYEGFSVELWDHVAGMLGVDYEIYGVNTIAKLLDDVKRGAADVAVAGIGITSDREKRLDFSHTYYSSGLQIMVREGSGSVIKEVFAKVQSVLLSSELIYAVGLFLIILMIAAHVIWILERNGNPQFPRSYPKGIW